MEHSQDNIDALRSDHEEIDSRMFDQVSHGMELYSKEGVVIWNIVKLTLFLAYHSYPFLRTSCTDEC